jgi:hypothetical protein
MMNSLNAFDYSKVIKYSPKEYVDLRINGGNLNKAQNIIFSLNKTSIKDELRASEIFNSILSAMSNQYAYKIKILIGTDIIGRKQRCDIRLTEENQKKYSKIKAEFKLNGDDDEELFNIIVKIFCDEYEMKQYEK